MKYKIGKLVAFVNTKKLGFARELGVITKNLDSRVLVKILTGKYKGKIANTHVKNIKVLEKQKEKSNPLQFIGHKYLGKARGDSLILKKNLSIEEAKQYIYPLKKGKVAFVRSLRDKKYYFKQNPSNEYITTLAEQYLNGNISSVKKRIAGKLSLYLKVRAEVQRLGTTRDVELFEQRMSEYTKNPVEIYDNLLEIRARKGKSSNWPKQNFKHSFKPGARVLGMADGSLKIVPKDKKKKLWKKFNYKK